MMALLEWCQALGYIGVGSWGAIVGFGLGVYIGVTISKQRRPR